MDADSRPFWIALLAGAVAFFCAGYMTALATAQRYSAFPVSVTGTELIYVVDGLTGRVRAQPTYTVPPLEYFRVTRDVRADREELFMRESAAK